jgi:hypothetical protein
MNYAKLAKIVVPVLLAAAGILGYGDIVAMVQSTVCAPAPLAPVVPETPDAG